MAASLENGSSGTISKLILSTGNIMTSGPSMLSGQGRPIFWKSNTELVSSLKTAFSSAKSATSQLVNGSRHEWTSVSSEDEDRVLHIPNTKFSSYPLAEDRPRYDITLKLFFLPSARSDASSRTRHAEQALNLVLDTLKSPNVDLLIVSFPGIAFDADDGSDEEEEIIDPGLRPEHSHEMPPLTRTVTADNRLTDSISPTWKGLESLHSKGLVSKLGLAEFGSERLQRFLPLTTIRPAVNQINVRDCCVVPKELILYAKQQGIQLLTHNDCTDILPPGTIREILEESFTGEDWLQKDIVPQWVVKYTAVVRERGVIENKGYFAMAEVR